jgi:hypothetical protein
MSEKWDAMEFDSSWRLHSRQRIFFMLNPLWDWTDEKTELGGLKAHCESPLLVTCTGLLRSQAESGRS